MARPLDEIRSELPALCPDLMGRENVIATGIGYKISAGKRTDTLAVICSVSAKKPREQLSAADIVPESVAGIPTDIVATGPIHSLQSPTGRFRPAPGGVSLGHYLITAGTLGCWVKRNGIFYILSNNHVIANSNDAAPGDPILQPGPTDGGSNPADQIATLTEFIPIAFDDDGGGLSSCGIAGSIASLLNGAAALAGSETRLTPTVVTPTTGTMAAENLVDAAIAEPLDTADVLPEILNIGTVNSIAEGTLGLPLKKMGRTTGLTTGEITQIDVTVQVSYGIGKVATFVDQLMAGEMSQGGDSGSAVLNNNNEIVGLLFAGGTGTTIINRIQNVFSALNLELP